MGYILLNAEKLKEKGIRNFELMPDGRAIADFSMLRVIGSMTDVEIVSTAEEMLSMIKEQEESGKYITETEEPAVSEEVPAAEEKPTIEGGNV